jgi:5-epi-alpha-selinene synthase
MEQFAMPDLYCPFRSGVNHHAEVVDRQTVDWARQLNLLTSEAAYKRIRATKVGWLTARVYPETPLNELQLLADWNTWLFAQDDECDELGVGKDPEHLTAIHARSLEIINGAQPTASDGPLVHGLFNLWKRTLRIAPPEWPARFIQHFKDCLDASIWEANNRAHGITPDVAAYMAKRVYTGGLYIHVALLEITDNIHLPQSARENPVVQRLTRMAVNVVCWANDILSLAKEIKQGDVHNLVLTLRHKHGLTLEQAIERAIALHNAEVRAFVDLESHLPTLEHEVDRELRRYIAILRSWMRGNLDWSYTSGRYVSTTLAAVSAKIDQVDTFNSEPVQPKIGSSTASARGRGTGSESARSIRDGFASAIA